MKVAIVTHFPKNPDVPHGGVEAVSVNLVKGLVQFSEIEIHVVTLDTEIDVDFISVWGEVHIHRLAVQKGSTLLNTCGAWGRILQKYLLEIKPDIIHAHDTYGIMVRGLPLPRVFTIHGFIHSDTLVAGQRFAWIRSKIWEFYEKRAWSDQPHIISISPYVRERLGGVAKGKIHDIDNPVAEEFFNIQRAEQEGPMCLL